MRRLLLSFLLPAALLLSVSGCASLPQRAGTPSHPGFDTWRYPGEEALRVWREASPYRWVGYYLPAPCRRGTSWVGTRPAVERLGWGVALLYVGQQAFEADTTGAPETGPILCSRTLLTAEQGRIDAADAVRKTQSEGFTPQSVIYLDVERMTVIPPGMLDYVRAWTDAVLRDGRYVPGLYAHADNAFTLHALVRASFREAGRAEPPPFWVTGGRGFSLDTTPEASGFEFATVWQGVLDVDRTWGGVKLNIDENVSTRPSPSAPLQPQPRSPAASQTRERP